MLELEDDFDDKDAIKPVLPYVYEASKVLGIKQFGMVIYNTVINFDASQVYDTETFKINQHINERAAKKKQLFFLDRFIVFHII